jgi:hypothetical protein
VNSDRVNEKLDRISFNLNLAGTDLMSLGDELVETPFAASPVLIAAKLNLLHKDVTGLRRGIEDEERKQAATRPA